MATNNGHRFTMADFVPNEFGYDPRPMKRREAVSENFLEETQFFLFQLMAHGVHNPRMEHKLRVTAGAQAIPFLPGLKRISR